MHNTTFLDKKYILFLSGRLRNFRDKGNDLFEFSHSCESGNRRRGYFYPKGNGYNFFCHNCNLSIKFYNFLKYEDNWLYKQYTTELFAGESLVEKEEPKKKQERKIFDIEGLVSVDEHPLGNKFIKDRKIPSSRASEMFFAEDFFTWASSFYKVFSEVKKVESRIVIPYINENDDIIGFTCRAIEESKRKYIELKLGEDEMIFGLNHINRSKKILCVEGPIDSMFLDNCVAVGGAAYQSEFVNKNKNNLVIIPDNDWIRNKQVCDRILQLGKDGYSISLFPEDFEYKDINEAIIDGCSANELKDMIMENVSSGPKLILDITFRRKC